MVDAGALEQADNSGRGSRKGQGMRIRGRGRDGAASQGQMVAGNTESLPASFEASG